MSFMDSFSNMSLVQLGICILLGYLGLKITTKILKIVCMLGIGFFAMRFFGLI